MAIQTPLSKRTLSERFAANVRQARIARGWTQTEFAKRLGVVQSRVADIESNRSSPTLDMMARVCEVLEVEPRRMISKQLGPVEQPSAVEV